MKQLFRTKTTTPEDFLDSGLKRCLSAFDLTLLGIGAIIGTGIFVLTGIAAAHQSGPAVVLSFVVSGIACAFAALAYAELAASVGGCGSAYGYSYAAFGELFAWIIGWTLLLEYGVAVAAVANGWSGYFQSALIAMGVNLPEVLLNAPSKGGWVNLPAMGIVVTLMVLLIIGVKQSARFNAAMVFVKLSTIAVFVAVAVFNVNPDNWSPFMPFGWFGHGPEGKPVGVLAGAAIVFFAYIGFDAVSTAAEEAQDPKRDLPIGILGSLAFCTVIYILVSGLLTGIAPYQELGVASPVAYALQRLGFNWASGLVSAGVIAGLTTVMLVLYYGLSRIIFAMARDGLLSTFFAEVNPRTHTPVRVIVMCGLIMATIAGLVPLGDLAELVNIGTLAAFVMVCLGVVILRKLRPEMKRPFKTPLSPLIPILGMLSCGVLMAALPFITWMRFILWTLIGLIIYFAYSIRHSKLAELGRTPAEQVELIEAIASGDQSALALLYEATCTQVYGLVLYILKDRLLAEETTHEVYLEVWREAAGYSEAQGAPLIWLMSLARNQAIGRLQALRAEGAYSSDESLAPAWAAIEPLPDHLGGNPQLAHDIQSAFQQLSLEQRQALYLAYFKGMSYSEIAEHLSLPLETIRTHIRTGMLRLRELLPGFGNGFRVDTDNP